MVYADILCEKAVHGSCLLSRVTQSYYRMILTRVGRRSLMERNLNVQARRVGGHSRSCHGRSNALGGKTGARKGSLPGGRLP